jgi:hypothetical protein
MKCQICGRETITVDFPTPAVYHVDDTEWGVHPNESGDPMDPGMLVPKEGAVPAMYCEGRTLI